MKWFNDSRIIIVLVAFVAAVVLSRTSAKADFTFGETVNLGPNDDQVGPTVNLNCSHEYSPCVSADGLELYFTSTRTGQTGCKFGDWNLWVSTRASKDDEWGPPESLGNVVNSPGHDAAPSLSPDGLELYFQSDRPGGIGEGDIWVTRRAAKGEPWGEPANLGAPVNSPTWDYNPNLSSDGLELYFAFDEGGTEFEPKLAVTRRQTTDSTWKVPEVLGAVVNSWPCQDTPWISADGLVLFFSDYWGCPRPYGFGGRDIWLTTRATKDSEWREPMNIGPSVNTSFDELFPMVSADGSTLYFSSDRCGGSGWGNNDLWQAPILPVVDFDGDGVVGMSDLTAMIGAWGTDDRLCDIGPMPWGDGVVDEADLEVLMSYWGTEVTVGRPALVAHWTFDETEGTIAHDSVSNNDANLIGDPVWQPYGGALDGALEFDGDGDYVDATGKMDLDRPFSIFAWAKGGDKNQTVVSESGNYGYTFLIADHITGNLMTMFLWERDEPLVSQTNIIDGQWHHVGLIWDANAATRILYVDGVEAAKGTVTRCPSTVGSSGLRIGASWDLTWTGLWSGLIDDVRVYKGALSPEEVATLAQ